MKSSFQYYAVYALLLVSAVAFGAPAADDENVVEDEEVYCPGYRPGSPFLAATGEGCRGGAKLDAVDHEFAFGINGTDKSPDWSACGIPTLPSENERVCYKTTIEQCEDGYHIYLNKRNLLTLQTTCPNETDTIPLEPNGELFFQSPRYSCKNQNNKPFRYRKSEFCLYNISLPNCSSGKVVIDNDLHYTQVIESRQRFRICTDYLQIFSGSFVSKKYCDTELSRSKIEIEDTNFSALFWTDTSINRVGFKLRVSCVQEPSPSPSTFPSPSPSLSPSSSSSSPSPSP